MPVKAIIRLYDNADPPNEIGIRIEGIGKGGLDYEILYANIPGNSWNANRLAKFADRAQQLIDVRIPLSDPSLVDDPHGPNGTDPARPDAFWDGGDLVYRRLEITNVQFTDRLIFTLRPPR